MLSTDTISNAVEKYRIRRLPNGLINKIAAGEEIERPASAVTKGKLIKGQLRLKLSCAMVVEPLSVSLTTAVYVKVDLVLAVERHANLKLPTDNLDSISTLGFRGEACRH